MRVKIFTGNGIVRDLENEINQWLSTNPVKVVDIKQSYTCDSKSCYAMMSVWFESTENINEI